MGCGASSVKVQDTNGILASPNSSSSESSSTKSPKNNNGNSRRLSMTGSIAGSKVMTASEDAKRRRLSMATTPSIVATEIKRLAIYL